MIGGFGALEALAFDQAAAVAGSEQDKADHEENVRKAQRGD